MSSETFVHAIYSSNEGNRSNSQDADVDVIGISAHIYPMSIGNDDIIGIYGYGALATKIVAMCLINLLFDTAVEYNPCILEKDKQSPLRKDMSQLQSIIDVKEPFLVEIVPNKEYTPEANRLNDDNAILKEWDDLDIINHHEKLDIFCSRIKFVIRSW